MAALTDTGFRSHTDRFAQPPCTARGPVSALLLRLLLSPASDGQLGGAKLPATVDAALGQTTDVVHDDDLQLALLLLYGLHYGGLIEADDAWEWQPELVAARVAIEREFERELRARVPVPATPQADGQAMAGALFELTKPGPGPSLARFIAKSATDEQAREFLVQRSIYTLKEADAHSWTIARLGGRAKSALVEIQADEYGGGRPDRMHSAIYARTMRGVGLDDRYGAYLDNVPAITIAAFNLMTMFGLNRRLRGASAGHLAAFEMTSSIPCRLYGDGFRRLGYDENVTGYFDEHVEADSVHEQIAGRDLAGSLAEDEPMLIADIMFGASGCLTVEGWAGQHLLDAWSAGVSSLRMPLAQS
jgi:Iron-containing redox enzyme